jgi:hypothetical protein
MSRQLYRPSAVNWFDIGPKYIDDQLQKTFVSSLQIMRCGVWEAGGVLCLQHHFIALCNIPPKSMP